MTEPLRPARLDWSQEVPFATDFSDIYFSRAGGAAEKTHVFIEQNDLPKRFQALTSTQGFTIIETGFGTGLNWLAAMDCWQKNSTDGWLHFVSVEKHPFTLADLERAQSYWPAYALFAEALQKNHPELIPGFHRLVLPQWRSTLTLFFGDVAEFLPRLSATADAWFLDGFSPERNAGMWNDMLYQGMAAHSHTGTTMATFTAAGHVRRGLVASGFVMEKVPGFGAKREMLCGRFLPASIEAKKHPANHAASPWLHRGAPTFPTQKACVIGAGIAGASTAYRLALRGWQVTVFESAADIATGASGNPAAIIYPRQAPPDEALDHFPQQAFHFSLQEFSQLPAGKKRWHACGVLQLLAGHQKRLRPAAEMSLPAPVLLSADEASAKAGIPLQHEALWHAEAGWLEPSAYCRELLDSNDIAVQLNTTVTRLEQCGKGWQLFDSEGSLLQTSDVVVIANGLSALHLQQTCQLPLQAVRGQLSLLSPSSLSAQLETVICHDGYLTPPLPGGQQCLGATFYADDSDDALRPSEHAENLELLRNVLPELADSLPSLETWQGRAALRCQSADYLPLLGPVADHDDFMKTYAGLRDGRRENYPALTSLPGLYVNLAHGSKGFSQAALAAEILAAEINHEPAPVSQKVLNALHPMRFWARQLKRHKNTDQAPT